MIAEYDNGATAASPSREYVYAGGQLLSTIDASGTKYHISGHLFAHVTMDATGNKLGEQGHYPFGETWYQSGTTTKWKFTTYERDPETGNDYAMARYHVNRLGRFASVDPLAGYLGNPQSLNRYSYVLNNPVNLIDPMGMDDCSDDEKDCDPSDPHDDNQGGGGGGGGDSSGDPGGIDIGPGVPVPPDPLLPPDMPQPPVPPGVGVSPSDPCADTTASGGCVSVSADPPADEGTMGSSIGSISSQTQSGGGSGDFRSLRSSLIKALLLDPDCLSFLGGKGAAVLATVKNTPIDVTHVANDSGVTAITQVTLSPTSDIPISASIHINDNGFFFLRGAQTSFGDLTTLNTGTPRFQAAILLHEFGHATGVLTPDVSIEQNTQNSANVANNCAKTISSFSNK